MLDLENEEDLNTRIADLQSQIDEIFKRMPLNQQELDSVTVLVQAHGKLVAKSVRNLLKDIGEN